MNQVYAIFILIQSGADITATSFGQFPTKLMCDLQLKVTVANLEIAGKKVPWSECFETFIVR